VSRSAATGVEWRPAEVTSPHLKDPVPVVAAEDIPYVPRANRLQNLSVYLPATPETTRLVGTPAERLPASGGYHVHIHGGAWRDPQLTARSIEPAVAHAFRDGPGPIAAVASLNYTLSRFPTHPTLPYDPVEDHHADPAREAVHPRHVSDVLHGLALLRSFGLTDRSYVLSGHSCGACLAFQAVLVAPRHHGLGHLPDAPVPAAVLGLNGLYDLPALVTGLGASHEHLRDDYAMFLSNAFGTDQDRWPAASPARFDPAEISARVRAGRAPDLVVLDQSAEDQLVPVNQKERFAAHLAGVSGLRVADGHRCTGRHAAPWEQGVMIWESVQDVLRLLR
jgi:kynurenine formamidase